MDQVYFNHTNKDFSLTVDIQSLSRVCLSLICLFVCFSHRSDLSIGELSIGEEIEDVSIEGPENSDKVTPDQLIAAQSNVFTLNKSSLFVCLFVVQFDETTQDVSISQLSQSHGADYMEDVS